MSFHPAGGSSSTKDGTGSTSTLQVLLGIWAPGTLSLETLPEDQLARSLVPSSSLGPGSQSQCWARPGDP